MPNMCKCTYGSTFLALGDNVQPGEVAETAVAADARPERITTLDVIRPALQYLDPRLGRGELGLELLLYGPERGQILFACAVTRSA
jgi:hypothetical protein